jgi:hypothetical protein
MEMDLRVWRKADLYVKLMNETVDTRCCRMRM